MTNYTVRVMGNGRIATRGLSRMDRGVCISIDEDERAPITVDWSAWLGTDVIASIDNDATNGAISNASNTATTTSLTISGAHGAGLVEHRITTQAGAVKELPIYINGQGERYGQSRYYDC